MLQVGGEGQKGFSQIRCGACRGKKQAGGPLAASLPTCQQQLQPHSAFTTALSGATIIRGQLTAQGLQILPMPQRGGCGCQRAVGAVPPLGAPRGHNHWSGPPRQGRPLLAVALALQLVSVAVAKPYGRTKGATLAVTSIVLHPPAAGGDTDTVAAIAGALAGAQAGCW